MATISTASISPDRFRRALIRPSGQAQADPTTTRCLDLINFAEASGEILRFSYNSFQDIDVFLLFSGVVRNWAFPGFGSNPWFSSREVQGPEEGFPSSSPVEKPDHIHGHDTVPGVERRVRRGDDLPVHTNDKACLEVIPLD